MPDKAKLAASFVADCGLLPYYICSAVRWRRAMGGMVGAGSCSRMARFASGYGASWLPLGVIRGEMRKVRSWPARKGSDSNHGLCVWFCLLMVILPGLTDKTLEWVLYDLILGWK